MFCCKGMRLANFMIENGCKLVRIDTNRIMKGFLVFIFEEDEHVSESLRKWREVKDTYQKVPHENEAKNEEVVALDSLEPDEIVVEEGKVEA